MTIPNIINRFIYRDLLYILGGAIIIFFIGYLYNYQSCFIQYLNLLKKFDLKSFHLLFLIGICYLLSLVSQILLTNLSIVKTKIYERNVYVSILIYIDNLRCLCLMVLIKMPIYRAYAWS